MRVMRLIGTISILGYISRNLLSNLWEGRWFGEPIRRTFRDKEGISKNLPPEASLERGG